MNDPLPPPDFDRTKYDRPNQDWVCGRTCEGQPCRLGPTPGGRCRSTAECEPVLEVAPGEAKGRWKCTRPKEAGGPCTDGPGPTGACGHPIIPCVPQSSLRRRRGKVTLATISLTFGLLLLLCSGRWRWSFISPGTVSSPHANPGFDAAATQRFGGGGCVGCHEAADSGVGQWMQAAFNADPGPFEWRKLARVTPDQHTRMDQQNCLACHAGYDRHQPTVTAAHSCSDCHREHQGERMAQPTDASCASCHGDASRLQRVLEAGTRDPGRAHADPSRFHPPLAAGLVAFLTPRAADRKPQPFTHYWDGHPEFALHRDGVRDPNTLKFNHALHLGATVQLHDPAARASRSLACRDCHQPDTTGTYMARIRFEQHCQSCHSLQFDPIDPGLRLPHGNPAAVASSVSSLAALQVQYATLARSRGETDRARIDAFARTSADRVRRLLGTGEQLVDLILFTGDPRPRMFTEDQENAGKRAHHAGCAYCHEVTRDARGQAAVTRPTTPDRWLPGGRFNHAKHDAPLTTCLDCHGTVRHSTRTADINLPHQTRAAMSSTDREAGLKACIDCHHDQAAPSGCATCHSYHMMKPL